MTATIDTTTMTSQLYVHKLRPQWGMAMVTSREPERLRLQFEDGENRTFARGYFDLLEEAAPQSDVNVTRVLERLMRAVGVSEARAAIMTRTAEEKPTELTDQIEAFLEAFPQGFGDEKWLKDVRGEGAKRRVKRHRDAAIVEARRILSRDRMKALRDQGKSHELWDGVIAVLSGTDLVSPKDIKALAGMSPSDQAIAVRRLYDLLYGDGSLPSRFNHWVHALKAAGKTPSWTVATVIQSLVSPETFCVVKPSSIRRQAKWMAPTLKVGRDPSGRTYVQIETMVIAVRTSLERENHTPRDLMDVTDFMQKTLKK